MKALPSTSKMRAPSAWSTKKGSPPTPRKARTGEFTPPGISCCARWKSSALRSVFMSVSVLDAGDEVVLRCAGHLLDPRPHEGAGSQVGDGPVCAQRDDAIQLRRLPGRPADDAVPVQALEEHRGFAADAGLRLLQRDGRLQLEHALQPLAPQRLRHLAGHGGRGRALL